MSSPTFDYWVSTEPAEWVKLTRATAREGESMKLEAITLDRVLSLSPCDDYGTRELLLKVTGGRESMTPLEVMDLDIPWDDCVWVLGKCLPARLVRHSAADWAEHVAHLWVAPEGVTWKPADTISVVRNFAEGNATAEELDAARDAARAAARAADAAWAAWAAAGAAADAAAGAAAWAAAGAAAGGVVWAAARAAARDAESDWQWGALRKRIENCN